MSRSIKTNNSYILYVNEQQDFIINWNQDKCVEIINDTNEPQ